MVDIQLNSSISFQTGQYKSTGYHVISIINESIRNFYFAMRNILWNNLLPADIAK